VTTSTQSIKFTDLPSANQLYPADIIPIVQYDETVDTNVNRTTTVELLSSTVIDQLEAGVFIYADQTSSMAVQSAISASYASNVATAMDTSSLATIASLIQLSSSTAIVDTIQYNKLNSLIASTASYLINSQTSSFASGSDVIKLFASSASSAVIDTVQTSQISSLSIATSSYVQNSQTSSFASGSDVNNLISEINVLTNEATSYITNSETSSMRVLFASSSQNAVTASFSLNVVPQNNSFTSSYLTTSSFNSLTSSFGQISGSYILSSSLGSLSRIGLSPSAIKNTGISNEIYIAYRLDGISGSGTKLDPYDGSTQPKFDSILGTSGGSTVNSVCKIYIGPGTFTTRGFAYNVGSQILGSGIDVTIIQLQSGSALTNGQKTEICTVNGNDTTGIDCTTIADLTVDGNFPNQPQSPNPICLDNGIQATQVLRCKVIQMGTTPEGAGYPYYLESFWMGGNSYARSNTIPAYNIVVKDSICISYNSSSYDTYITAGGRNPSPDSPSTVAAINAIIDNCKVICTTVTGTSAGHAFTLANCDGGTVQNCYTDGIAVGYYQDTWANHNLVIRNNKFCRAEFGVNLNGDNSTYNNIILENNYIDLNPTAAIGETYGVYFYLNKIEKFSIQNNHILQTPYMTPLGGTWSNGINDGGSPIGIKVVSYGASQNGIISNNCIDTPYGEGLQSRVVFLNISNPNSSDSPNIQCENNYDSYGEWIFGKRHSRRTFIQTTSSGNRIWGYDANILGNGGGDAHARLRVAMQSLLGQGTVTLSNGISSQISIPSITAVSKIVLHLSTASNFVSTGLGIINTPGTGFIVSGSLGDNSTYLYYISSGINPNIVDLNVNIPNIEASPAVITQTSYTNPFNNPTEPYFTGPIYAYWNGSSSNGGCEVNATINKNALVTVDIYDQNDFQMWYCGNGQNGAQGAYTSLTLDYTKGLLTTGGIGASNYTTAISKSLTVNNILTLAGTDSSTLNIGSGGTLGSAAFTSSPIVTANSSSVITFNSNSKTETIYNTSNSTISTATITLPTLSSIDQIARYLTAGTVNSVTMSGASVVIGVNPSSIAANGSIAWQAVTSNTWVRLY
jgi:hypothetical protein